MHYSFVTSVTNPRGREGDSVGKVRSSSFSFVSAVHGKFQGCDFLKNRSVCGCIIRQGNASQLVPTV